jgi:hypothetical protein
MMSVLSIGSGGSLSDRSTRSLVTSSLVAVDSASLVTSSFVAASDASSYAVRALAVGVRA